MSWLANQLPHSLRQFVQLAEYFFVGALALIAIALTCSVIHDQLAKRRQSKQKNRLDLTNLPSWLNSCDPSVGGTVAPPHTLLVGMKPTGKFHTPPGQALSQAKSVPEKTDTGGGENFLTSAVVAGATQSSIIGYAVGGSLPGAIVGGALTKGYKSGSTLGDDL